MSRFYILVDDIVKAKFFIDFDKKVACIFITNKLSCYAFLKFKGASKIIFLDNNRNTSFNKEGLEGTISVLNNRQSIDDAKVNYSVMRSSLGQNIKEKITDSDYLIIFNGSHVSAIATIDYFRSFGVKLLFSEISNLPNKMFFDPCGVNAQSFLFEEPELLDLLPSVSDEDHEQWVSSYLAYKLSPIPQSIISIPNYVAIAIDDIFSRLSICIREDSLSFLHKMKMFLNKFNAKSISGSYKRKDLSSNYAFFPTQVSFDTQLKINSKVDNLDALKCILKSEKLPLFVKIHPGESNMDLIHRYIEMEAEGDIHLVNNDTIELIKNANKIYTINSTVGLEALILKKDVTILGKAIYSNFDYERIKKYVHHYLVPLNYFSQNTITDDLIDHFHYFNELPKSKIDVC